MRVGGGGWGAGGGVSVLVVVRKKKSTDPGVVIKGSHLQDRGSDRQSLQHGVRVVQRIPARREQVARHLDASQGCGAPGGRPTVQRHHSALCETERVKLVVSRLNSPLHTR